MHQLLDNACAIGYRELGTRQIQKKTTDVVSKERAWNYHRSIVSPLTQFIFRLA